MNDEMIIAHGITVEKLQLLTGSPTATSLATVKIMPAHVLELVRMIVEQRAQRTADERRGAVFWISRKEKS